MTDTVHKGQKQVVEGSAVGEYYVISKFAYNCLQLVEYMGESKIGISDHVSRHYIQKCEYDCVGNLERILIATNKSTVDSDNIDLIPINDTQTKIILNTGDFNESNIDDSVNLKTGTQELIGTIYKKISSNEIIVGHGEKIINQDLGVSISKTDLTVTFKHDSTKDYTKRKWSNRERYFYKTL